MTENNIERKNEERTSSLCLYYDQQIQHGSLYWCNQQLFKRVNEHKEKLVGGFTSRYNVTKLVYYEEFETMPEAIAREKQLKGGSRQKKNGVDKQ